MNQGLTYSVDLALCIDATGSMSPVIDEVKKAALQFHDDLAAEMEVKSKAIDTLRLRVLVFRDYFVDGASAMTESPFFALPDQKEEFSRFVDDIAATGGGDEPENGLEALALAIRSDWSKTGDKRRQIVIVWTDASCHPLEKGAASSPEHYPSSCAANLDELTDMWEGQEHVTGSGKRLVLFAPDSDNWTTIANNWDNTVHYASRAGEGMADFTYKEILSAIAASV